MNEGSEEGKRGLSSRSAHNYPTTKKKEKKHKLFMKVTVKVKTKPLKIKLILKSEQKHQLRDLEF